MNVPESGSGIPYLPKCDPAMQEFGFISSHRLHYQWARHFYRVILAA